MMMALDSRTLRFYSGEEGTVATLLGERRLEMAHGTTSSAIQGSRNSNNNSNNNEKSGSNYNIELTEDEAKLFELLRKVTSETKLGSTLRVAGGWVRDKLLATPEFQRHHHSPPEKHKVARMASKFHKSSQGSMGRQGTKLVIEDDSHQPVDIDIALDDMLGREFADHLNEFLQNHGEKTVSVGVVLKNPEKSKHLETATMKVGSFWIDFVNLRAEEYTQNSRIPDMMRIGTPSEDAFRRDLTINSLFYNINSQQVEDFTGRGFDDLKRGAVATPMAPLTTLLDDPLRVLRAVRFAARLRFTMDTALIQASRDAKVRDALAQKVSRERVGGEVDLMLRSPDPVGAMRLLINLNLIETVFPIREVLPEEYPGGIFIFTNGLNLLSTTFDYLCDNKRKPPLWCEVKQQSTTHGFCESTLLQDEEARRLLWYAAFLKPLHDYSILLPERKPSPQNGKKANRSVISKLLVDHLKRPSRDAENIEKITRAADDFTKLMGAGFDLSAESVLLSGIRVHHEVGSNGDGSDTLCCRMGNKVIDSETEDDPLWQHAMEFRLLTSKVLGRVGHLWRAAFVLSLVEELVSATDDDLEYRIEGDVVSGCPLDVTRDARFLNIFLLPSFLPVVKFEESQEERRQGIVDQYDAFAAALQKLGLIGVWTRKPLIDGDSMKAVLPNIPVGPGFREVMDEQQSWMTTHPGGGIDALSTHLREVFADFA